MCSVSYSMNTRTDSVVFFVWSPTCRYPHQISPQVKNNSLFTKASPSKTTNATMLFALGHGIQGVDHLVLLSVGQPRAAGTAGTVEPAYLIECLNYENTCQTLWVLTNITGWNIQHVQ